MPYKTLGSRSAQGQLDNTGQNPGNWTVTFPPNLINVTVFTDFEVWKIVVTNGAPGATLEVFVNNYLWDTAVYATQNSWDPQQPLILRPGDTLYFYYSDPATDGFQPTVWIWLRHEVTLGLLGGGA